MSYCTGHKVKYSRVGRGFTFTLFNADIINSGLDKERPYQVKYRDGHVEYETWVAANRIRPIDFEHDIWTEGCKCGCYEVWRGRLVYDLGGTGSTSNKKIIVCQECGEFLWNDLDGKVKKIKKTVQRKKSGEIKIDPKKFKKSVRETAQEVECWPIWKYTMGGPPKVTEPLTYAKLLEKYQPMTREEIAKIHGVREDGGNFYNPKQMHFTGMRHVMDFFRTEELIDRLEFFFTVANGRPLGMDMNNALYKVIEAVQALRPKEVEDE